MSYVIENDIPLPKAKKGSGGNFVGPQSEWTKALYALEPGQSVLTPFYNEFKSAEQVILRQRPKKFAIRKVDGQGWRVWRIE